MKRTRSGSDVREFCAYYVLELLRGRKRLSRSELIQAIAERSAENRSYRQSGVLRVPTPDMEEVLRDLEARGWVKALASERTVGGGSAAPGGEVGFSGNRKWRITGKGRRARARIAEQEQKHTGGKESAARRLLRLLGEPPARGWVLDVGTGEGFLAFKLARRGFRVLGVDSGAFDYSKESLEKARGRARSFGGRLDFCQADVIQVPEGVCGDRLPRRFTWVTASQSIHCMSDQRRCLATIFTVLRPGGRFLAMDFSVGVRGFLGHGFHCFLAPTRGEWVELLGSAGFRDLAFYEIRDYLLVQAHKPRRPAPLMSAHRPTAR